MPVNAAPIRSVAPAGLATGQAAVTASPTLIVAARTDRRGVLIINGSAVELFIGDATVTIGTGLRLVPIAGTGIMIPTEHALYGVSGGAGNAVSYMELY